MWSYVDLQSALFKVTLTWRPYPWVFTLISTYYVHIPTFQVCCKSETKFFLILHNLSFLRNISFGNIFMDLIFFSISFVYHSFDKAPVSLLVLQGFLDVCLTEPFDPYLTIYIEGICGFYEIYIKHSVFYGVTSCLRCTLSLLKYCPRRTYVYHVLWHPLCCFWHYLCLFDLQWYDLKGYLR